MTKNYIIFGGSGDLGKRLSTALLSLDHTNVWSSYKTENRDIEGIPFYFDAEKGLSPDILKEFSKIHIDGLVYLVGVKSSKRLIRETSLKEWEELIDINALSFLRVYNQLYSVLRDSGTKIVVVSSSAPYENKRLNGAYSGSKALLESICLTIAKEEQENGIKINIIAPSLIDTKLAREIVKMKGYDDFEQYVTTCLNGKILKTTDVIKTIYELLSDETNSNISGQIIRLGDYDSK